MHGLGPRHSGRSERREGVLGRKSSAYGPVSSCDMAGVGSLELRGFSVTVCVNPMPCSVTPLCTRAQESKKVYERKRQPPQESHLLSFTACMETVTGHTHTPKAPFQPRTLGSAEMKPGCTHTSAETWTLISL